MAKVLKPAYREVKGPDGKPRRVECGGTLTVIAGKKTHRFRRGEVYENVPAAVLKSHGDRFADAPRQAPPAPPQQPQQPQQQGAQGGGNQDDKQPQ